MSVERILGALANSRGLVAKKILWRGRGGHRIHFTVSTRTWCRVTIRSRLSVFRVSFFEQPDRQGKDALLALLPCI
jgi:hypothetical protein